MRAVTIRDRKLTLEDHPDPEPGTGEVRIAVKAAAVNPTDIALRERGDPDLPPPWVPGMDAAGIVESLGPDVDRLEIGQEVMAAVSPRTAIPRNNVLLLGVITLIGAFLLSFERGAELLAKRHPALGH